MREISAGEVLAEEDIAVLRTEKVLRPGLGPEFLSAIVGARARRQIPDGEGIVWADLL
jgi:sialic acid synthase SpsE